MDGRQQMPRNKKKTSTVVVVQAPKQKQQQQRKRKPRKAKKFDIKMVPKMNKEQSLLHKQICGLTDPFCEHAVGMKYPDSSNVRTLTLSQHFRTVLGSDGSGNGALLILPNNYYSPFVPVSVDASTKVGTCAAFSAGESTPVSGMSKFRINSWGCVIRRVLPPLTSSGMIYVRQFGDEIGTNLATFATASYNRSAVIDSPVQDAKELTVFGKRTTQMPQVMYTDGQVTPSSAVTAWVAAGWVPISIAVEGAPNSSSVASIECFINYEYTFEDTSLLTLLATPAIKYNSVLAAASSEVSSTVVPFVKEGLEKAGKMVEEAAAKTLKNVLRSALSGPLR